MHTDRFSGRATAYVSGRPSYPVEAVDVLLDGLGEASRLSVADLGAGTGISSRLIASRGPRVLAIEPNASMRAAAQADPQIEWIDGTAERTGLPAGSVDVVAAFQAWHWVEHAAGVAEARRILRGGGRLGAVYNERDERDPFTAAYGDIVRRYARDETELRRTEALMRFASIDPARTRRFEFLNVQALDRAGLHARAESTSYLPHEGKLHSALHADLDALLDEFAPAGAAALRLVTIVSRVDVPAGGA